MSSDGFEAMGKPVPYGRMSNAYTAVRAMIPDITAEDAMSLVGRVADRIERDDPYGAMREATDLPFARASHLEPYTPQPGVRLDQTGGYRLLATLCTG